MEDARLNYIEQHAPAIGLSTEKLEHARLHAAKASPMGETLDVLMGHVDEEVMKELVPVIASVLRSGVGLNTRAGAGRLCTIMSSSRLTGTTAAGKLFKSLLAAANADQLRRRLGHGLSRRRRRQIRLGTRVNQLVDDLWRCTIIQAAIARRRVVVSRSSCVGALSRRIRRAQISRRRCATHGVRRALRRRPSGEEAVGGGVGGECIGSEFDAALISRRGVGKCAHRLASAQYQQKKQGGCGGGKRRPRLSRVKYRIFWRRCSRSYRGECGKGKRRYPRRWRTSSRRAPNRQRRCPAGAGEGSSPRSSSRREGKKQSIVRRPSRHSIAPSRLSLRLPNPQPPPRHMKISSRRRCLSCASGGAEVWRSSGSGGDARGGGIGRRHRGEHRARDGGRAHRKEQARSGAPSQTSVCVVLRRYARELRVRSRRRRRRAPTSPPRLSPVNTWTGPPLDFAWWRRWPVAQQIPPRRRPCQRQPPPRGWIL